jgi:hypothetical protein
MKKMVWLSVILGIIGFATLSNDPLNDTANFIIAGSVPGTDISIGLWSTLLLAFMLLWVVNLGFKKARLQMLEHTATQIKNEEEKIQFKESNSGESINSGRSVIAAPTAENAI